MKKIAKKILVWIVILCVLGFLFDGCYYIETTKVKRYEAFYNEMEKHDPSIYQTLPNPEGVQIEELYLYYSDYDLIDSAYCVYVNGVFDDEGYAKEKERLYNLAKYDRVIDYNSCFNSCSFDYESIVKQLTLYNTETHADYMLFDDSERRIVYVEMFDFDGKYENIPQKYLPFALR